MKGIPVNSPQGCTDVFGVGDYVWRSIAEFLAAMAMAMPPGTSGAVIYAHAPLNFSMSPQVVADNPYITPITLVADAKMELCEAEQVQQLRILDDGGYFSIQFFALPSLIPATP